MTVHPFAEFRQSNFVAQVVWLNAGSEDTPQRDIDGHLQPQQPPSGGLFFMVAQGYSAGSQKTAPSKGARRELKDGESSRALVNATFNDEDDPGSAASRLVSVSTTPPERSMIALAAPVGLFTTGAPHPNLVTVR
jgi:hypothetical protein